MTGPPGELTIQGHRAGPGVTTRSHNYVQVLNSPWNGRGFIKRKVAEHYIRSGRAEWLTKPTMLRMIDSEELEAARKRAAAGYNGVNRVMRPEELCHLPLAGDPWVLLTKQLRTSRHFVGRSGPMKQIHLG